MDSSTPQNTKSALLILSIHIYSFLTNVYNFFSKNFNWLNILLILLVSDK